MANHKGSEGVVKVGSDTVLEVRGFSVNEKMSPIDDTELGDAWVTQQAGEKSWSAQVECYWDETDSTGQEALSIGASVTLNLYPEGATSGDKFYSGVALVTDIGVAVTRNGITTRTISVAGAGTLTYAAVA